PVTVISPESPQAASSQPGDPTSRADSAEVMKIPDPIIDPITIIVASVSPSPRTSFGAVSASACASGIRLPGVHGRIESSGARSHEVLDAGRGFCARPENAEDRGQRTEDKGQRTKDKGQRTQNRGQGERC